MIAGFQEPTSGDLLIKNKSVLDVAPNKRPVSMVFQHLALFPMMNIAANVGFGLRQRGVDKREIESRVEKVLERVGLPGVGKRSINQLSGGQKQRIGKFQLILKRILRMNELHIFFFLAIARALLRNPKILLLDEGETNRNRILE